MGADYTGGGVFVNWAVADSPAQPAVLLISPPRGDADIVRRGKSF